MYKLLIPDSPSSAITAAYQAFLTRFKAATSLDLAVVQSANYVATDRYISLGETALSASLDHSYSLLGNDGAALKTDSNKNIIAVGATETGTIYACNTLLSKIFNFDYFGDGAYKIDTGVTEKDIPIFDEVSRPSFDYRASGDGVVTASSTEKSELRVNNYEDYFAYIGDNYFHNWDSYLKDSANYNAAYWTSGESGNDENVCFTAHGDATQYENMLNATLLKIQAHLASDSTHNFFCFGYSDKTYHHCTCAACQAVVNSYGSISATYIKFMNDLRTKLDTWLAGDGSAYLSRNIQLVMLGYHPGWEDAPTINVGTNDYTKLKDGIGLLRAASDLDYRFSVNNSFNSAKYKAGIEAWKNVTSNLYLWTYCTNFYEYLIPFDSFGALRENYNYFATLGAKYIFDQGPYNETGYATGFGALKAYLQSKLAWNATMSESDYQTCISNFFASYYGEAATTMKSLFDAFRALVAEKNPTPEDSSCFQESSVALDAAEWPEASLTSFLASCDSALSQTSSSEVKRRIKGEKVSFLYLYIKLYSSASDIATRKSEFKDCCTTCGIVRYGEAAEKTIASLLTSWGL